MTNYREILRLNKLGISKAQIAAGCGCARSTIQRVLQRAEMCNLTYPLPEEMTDRHLAEALFPSVGETVDYKLPDCEYVHREMAKSGVTLSLLWLEYCEQCRTANEISYQLTQFKKYYRDFVVSTKATMHINHKPGELMQVDWAGDTAHVVNTDTGEFITAYVFVASLPYSGYAYAETFFSMDTECWICAHVNAFNYFGGITRIIQCDNLKTGVTKNTRSEVVLNKSYQEMAEHYGTAIIPCRVKAPKDKGHVEGTVGIISTWILAALRDQQFLSLYELNSAIREKLNEFNNKPFQRKEGSRQIAFGEEKLFLIPLPQNPFELATWKIATVQYNYHISVDSQNYSVPYEYIKQKVDVRLTRNIVEVFFEGHRICSHPRLYGRKGQYSTQDIHMPPDHRKYVEWNGNRFRKWAEKIGSNTAAVVEHLLTSHPVEQQGYKSCMALLKLADNYSIDRLEAACKKAFSYTVRPSLKSVQTILKSGQDKLPVEEQPLSQPSPYGFTRGAAYYAAVRRGDNAE